MIANIIIRIHSESPDSFEWLTLDSDGLLLAQGVSELDQLQDFVEDWQGKPLILLVPGKSCLSIQQNIPAKSQRQIKAALPFAVEDQFAEEIENLHFAIGKRSETGEVSALVASKSMMESWLHAFDKVGLTPKIATADHQSLPHPEDASVLLISENNSLLRLKSGSSYSIPNTMLTMLMQQFAVSTKTTSDNENENENESDPNKEKLIVINAQKISKQQLQEIQQDWNIQVDDNEMQADSSSQDELLLLAQNALSSETINLLQGSYRRRSPSSKVWTIWKLPAIAASLMLLLLITGWAIDYWSLNNKLERLKQAQIEVYKNAFPGETRVVRPVSQMRGKMKSQGTNASASAFLPLLNKFSKALAKVNQTQITNINFRANKGELKIAFLAPDFATIQKLQAELKALQLEVTPGASNAAGDQYSGRVTIKDKN